MQNLETGYWGMKLVLGYILKNWSDNIPMVIFREEKFYTGIILRCSSGNKFEKHLCICFDIWAHLFAVPKLQDRLSETWYDYNVVNFVGTL
jgi:hypothetical protein